MTGRDVPQGAQIMPVPSPRGLGYVISYTEPLTAEQMGDLVRHLVVTFPSLAVHANEGGNPSLIGIVAGRSEPDDFAVLAGLKELFRPLLPGIAITHVVPIQQGFQLQLVLLGTDERESNVVTARLAQLLGFQGATAAQVASEPGWYVLTFTGELTQERADELTTAFAEIGISTKVSLPSSLALWVI